MQMLHPTYETVFSAETHRMVCDRHWLLCDGIFAHCKTKQLSKFVLCGVARNLNYIPTINRLYTNNLKPLSIHATHWQDASYPQSIAALETSSLRKMRYGYFDNSLSLADWFHHKRSTHFSIHYKAFLRP
jgi:hypothetical protein